MDPTIISNVVHYLRLQSNKYSYTHNLDIGLVQCEVLKYQNTCIFKPNFKIQLRHLAMKQTLDLMGVNPATKQLRKA